MSITKSNKQNSSVRKAAMDTTSWSTKEADLGRSIEEVPREIDEEANLYDEDSYVEEDDVDSY